MTDKVITGAEDIVWDLSDLYTGMADPQLDADLDACDAEADVLGEAYRGRIAGLNAADLAALIARYEALAERMGKVGAFASLNWTQDTQDAVRGALMQRVTGARLAAQPKTGADPDPGVQAHDPALIPGLSVLGCRHEIQHGCRRSQLTYPECPA